ncbi:MAG: M20/M25/M40 family metallo-hydrolase [Planctomycetes bacterium]|nr:M20/M25/M40 family metallo-hydrolase [Planctomycetota bacterium]
MARDAGQSEKALRYLEQRMQGMGYATYRESAGSFLNVEQWNLFAEISGTVDPKVICEIGAHYDTVEESPGADDNGSGVAGILQVAKALQGYSPERTIRFCFFAAEEVGILGSAAHVALVLEREQEEVDGLLNLEMIGYMSKAPDSQGAPIRIPILASLPSTGDFILVAGNFFSGRLGNIFETCVDRFVPDLKYYSANRIAGCFSDAARSDHSSYWQAGLRGVMVSDTANFRNPNYHQSTDTIETIDFEFMAKVSRAAVATMMVWAGWAGTPALEVGQEP